MPLNYTSLDMGKHQWCRVKKILAEMVGPYLKRHIHTVYMDFQTLHTRLMVGRPH